MMQWSESVDVFRDVSRETRDRLTLYAELLRKWQQKINLVSNATLENIWIRHFADSAQLFNHIPQDAKNCLDLGSGGGFPGLVCAILAAGSDRDTNFVFLESDGRKCTFLREVLRQTSVKGTVLNERIERAPPQNADVITARALAPLASLLSYSRPHLAPFGICLFQKGATYKDELSNLPPHWTMKTSVIPSMTATESVILKLDEITHATPK